MPHQLLFLGELVFDVEIEFCGNQVRKRQKRFSARLITLYCLIDNVLDWLILEGVGDVLMELVVVEILWFITIIIIV